MPEEKQNQQEQKGSPMEVPPSQEEKVLFEWTALKRPYQKKDKEFWVTVLSVLGLVSLILFFVKEWFLIAALMGFVFLYYVLTTVQPEKSKYKITNKGIYISSSEKLDWDALKRFWINDKWGYQVLNLETWLKFPRVVSLVIPEDKKQEVTDLLEKYLPQEEESPQFLDKFTDWLARKFPLETSDDEL